MFSKLSQSKVSRFFKVMSLVLVSVVVLAACGKDDELSLSFKNTDSDVKIATYTDGEVTDKEYNTYMSTFALAQGIDKSVVEAEGYNEFIVEQYIIYKQLAQNASNDDKVAAEEQTNSDFEVFNESVTQAGLDLEELYTTYGIDADALKTFMYISNTVVTHINNSVTDEELKAEYEAKLADYATYDVRHILIQNDITDAEGNVTSTRTEEEVLALAQEAKAKLDAGESWEAVAKQYSEDPGSKENGGLYADAKGMNWEENFKQAAFTQEVGVIGEPVKSQFGYHVMLVEKRDSKPFAELEEIDLEEVRNFIANGKFAGIYETKSTELNIEYNFPEAEVTEEAPEATNEEATEETTK